MSVKSKVKRCNNEIKRLQEELETYQLANRRLKEKMDSQNNNKILENIVKFAITKHVGSLKSGMQVDKYSIDMMNDLRLDIDYNRFENSYIMRVNYKY